MDTNKIRIIIIILIIPLFLFGCNSKKNDVTPSTDQDTQDGTAEGNDQEEQDGTSVPDANDEDLNDSMITFILESEIDAEPVTYENKEWADEFNDIFDAIINDESLFEIDSLENINDVYMRVGDRVIAYMNPDTYWEFKYDKVAYYVELHNAVHNEEKYVLLDVDSELGKRLSELAALLMGE